MVCELFWKNARNLSYKSYKILCILIQHCPKNLLQRYKNLLQRYKNLLQRRKNLLQRRKNLLQRRKNLLQRHENLLQRHKNLLQTHYFTRTMRKYLRLRFRNFISFGNVRQFLSFMLNVFPLIARYIANF
jgi:hypothetical protein